MLFDVDKLEELKGEISRRSGCDWHTAILDKLDPSQRSGHSDYETYGQYVFNHYRPMITLDIGKTGPVRVLTWNDSARCVSIGRNNSIRSHFTVA